MRVPPSGPSRLARSDHSPCAPPFILPLSFGSDTFNLAVVLPVVRHATVKLDGDGGEPPGALSWPSVAKSVAMLFFLVRQQCAQSLLPTMNAQLQCAIL